jgi:hypothetical protein
LRPFGYTAAAHDALWRRVAANAIIICGSNRRVQTLPIITTDDVAVVFSDEKVAELLAETKLPPGTNKALLAEGVREAARIFARDARLQSGNELHNEIGKLYEAADRRGYDEVAALLEYLSRQTLAPGLRGYASSGASCRRTPPARWQAVASHIPPSALCPGIAKEFPQAGCGARFCHVAVDGMAGGHRLEVLQNCSAPWADDRLTTISFSPRGRRVRRQIRSLPVQASSEL